MSASATQLSAVNTDLIANVFDVLPQPAFVVDPDFNVIDFNLAGSRLLDRLAYAVLRLRGGDGRQCVHSIETSGDASTAACEECVVKNFVRQVFVEPKASRKIGKLRLSQRGHMVEADFLITVAPIPDESEPLALLILDEAAELSDLLEPKGEAATPASFFPGSKGRATGPAHKKGNS